MIKFFKDIFVAGSTIAQGMSITMKHFLGAKNRIATLQYPEERWPRPERNIGFDHGSYNVIRSRLHVAPERGEDIKDVKHVGITSNGSRKAMVVTRFDIDMSECCYCNLCTYPCPEECIFMTGGPNSKKHPIDYEFSEPDRSDLIYRFAKPGTKEGMEKILNEKKVEA